MTTINYFTKEEAEAKVGYKVQTLVHFSGVPAGSTGTVTGVRDYTDGDYAIIVTYDLPSFIGTLPAIHYFGKQEYEKFLQVIP